MPVPALPFVGMPVLYRDPENPAQPVPGTVTLCGAGADGYLVNIVPMPKLVEAPNTPWFQFDTGQPGSCYPNPQLPWN